MVSNNISDDVRYLIEEKADIIAIHRYGFIKLILYKASESTILLACYDSRIESLDQCVTAELIVSETWLELVQSTYKYGNIFEFGRCINDRDKYEPEQQQQEAQEYVSKIVAKP